MHQPNMLELHYHLAGGAHAIDAMVRNKCEAELLGMLVEAANLLQIDPSIIKEVYKEGGFRDIWKLMGKSSQEITILLLIIQIIISAVPLFDLENKKLEEEEKRLGIEEKRLNIERLKQEIKQDIAAKENIEMAATSIGANLKIIKRKSNFYSFADNHNQIEAIGVNILDQNFLPISTEHTVPKSNFRKYILTTNRLKSEEDDNAEIEIISPVLKEGRYKWKGMYKEVPISFEMQDHNFRNSVLLENIPFQHGSKIRCVLVAHRELDEVGDIKITGYSVTTVIEKIDGDSVTETQQGKKYRFAKRFAESQTSLFGEKNTIQE